MYKQIKNINLQTIYLYTHTIFSIEEYLESGLYSPMKIKLIIMVIDGLRWDFVAGPTGNAAMPVTSKLLANSSGCLLRVKLQSPTVTMPRIKVKEKNYITNFIIRLYKNNI